MDVHSVLDVDTVADSLTGRAWMHLATNHNTLVVVQTVEEGGGSDFVVDEEGALELTLAAGHIGIQQYE